MANQTPLIIWIKLIITNLYFDRVILNYPYKTAKSRIFYLLLTGCQWKLLPRVYVAPSTVHDRFQEWRKAGFFESLWIAGLFEYDLERGLKWE